LTNRSPIRGAFNKLWTPVRRAGLWSCAPTARVRRSFPDLSIDGADNGLRIKSNNTRGGIVRDVVYSDIWTLRPPRLGLFRTPT
jgi:hypothetical protein